MKYKIMKLMTMSFVLIMTTSMVNAGTRLYKNYWSGNKSKVASVLTLNVGGPVHKQFIL